MAFADETERGNSMPGTICVVIGPNGYGKTTYLNDTSKELANAGESILMVPSEIKLLDEVKDTVDTSQTMEFLLSEILETPSFVKKREALYAEADKAIASHLPGMNQMLEEVLSLNGSKRTKDFIAPNPKRTIKNLVSFGQDDIKKKMGSGQRMHLLLKLAAKSSKDHIFLDEPEKYSHPSLLNGTAKAINDLVAAGKDVYIATHSPKLVSMLNFDLGDLRLINDPSHALKEIPFNEAVAAASAQVNVGSMQGKFKRYYESGDSLKECVSKRHSRTFIEALFTRKVFLCEGANDELFINASLQQHGGFYDDYVIFKVWGKSNLPVFIELFERLGIELVTMFDVDDESKDPHSKLNPVIRSYSGTRCRVIEFMPNLEAALGYKGKKDDALGLIDHLESAGVPAEYSLA